MIVKRIQPMSLAKVMAVVYGGIGLIVGAVFSLFSLVGAAFLSSAAEQGALPPFFGLLFGMGAIVVLPIFYGFFGFLGGLIVSSLYNATSRATGGVELEVE